jgi:hypothetical protein
MNWEGVRTVASTGGIASLNEEALDDAVEDGVVVVAFEAELDEVADGLRGLFGPQLDVQRPVRGIQHHLALRRWLQHVYRRHLFPSRSFSSLFSMLFSLSSLHPTPPLGPIAVCFQPSLKALLAASLQRICSLNFRKNF